MNHAIWQNLAQYLNEQSQEICALNQCTEDEHQCESYAYIQQDGSLLDICASDYFQGCTKPYAAIPLPWSGTGNELQIDVEDQCFDFGV